MRIVIIGNSGSGKSTLARLLAASYCLASLDLDGVAWVPNRIADPRPEADAAADVQRFCDGHPDWVIEGCYAGLAAIALTRSPVLLFLDPGVDACIDHCRRRPWEPHKYASKQAQDEKLDFLLGWVRSYYSRGDELSLSAHQRLFDSFEGRKLKLTRPFVAEPAAGNLEGLGALTPMASGRLPQPPGALSAGRLSLRLAGVTAGEPTRGFVPYYHFLVIVGGEQVGHINFRVGDTEHVQVAAGHIGYEILEPHRGHRYALEACRAIAPFVRLFYESVCITSEPDNLASIRTLERLGAQFVDRVTIPAHDPHFARGSRLKNRYSWTP